MPSILYNPQSPLGALERFFLGSSQPEDVDLLHKILFDVAGRLTDPHNCRSCSLDHRPFTDAVCAKWGWDRNSWHKVVIAIFGDRAEDVPNATIGVSDCLRRTRWNFTPKG